MAQADIDNARLSGGGAIRSGKAHLRLWLIAGLGWAADWASKAWILKVLGDHESGYLREPIIIIPDYLRLVTVLNPGAIWGMAAGKTIFLISASLLGLVFLFWFFYTSRPDQWLIHSAVGMLIAGDLGNLYDRIFNNGKVVDFIEVNLHFRPANPWPLFNIADMLLCLGVGILLISVFASQKADHPKTK